ncbi:MAG: peptidylprolyl isomerase, partial [Cyclobacteriaceae bacterium]|nr:peptidylprolyl isomerase [Cyclobacteriaceae bacterium]
MFNNKAILPVIMLFTLSMSACGPKKDYLVTIKTSYGDIKLILFDDTPQHKKNFIGLAQKGRYDSTTFHRVINEFMIQGGDVNSKEGTQPTPDAMIPAEILPHHFHRKGALAAARNNNPLRKSSECQFYIIQGSTYTQEQLTLDHMELNKYFGRLLGMAEYQELREEVIALQQAQDVQGMEAKMAELK